jgi:hypothetical protein
MRIYTRPSSRIDLIARASQSVRASTMLRPLAPGQAGAGPTGGEAPPPAPGIVKANEYRPFSGSKLVARCDNS